MSQHPSLSTSSIGSAHRSVLKRHERIKILQDKKQWTDGASVLGLPKVKTLRIKIRKEKAAEEKTPAAGAAAGSTATGTPAAASGKPTGSKEPAKGK